MNQYFKNMEYLAKKQKLDMMTFASKVDMDYSDLRRPTPDDLIRIADFFSISIDLLLRGNLIHHDELKNFELKLLVMDVDGVLTDGGMYYSESGDEYKKFNAKDGMALKMIRKQGVKTGIISNGSNTNLVGKRAAVLQIDLVEVGQNNKLDVLKAWCAQLGFELSQVAYVGDDLNDIEVMQSVGFSACPHNAAETVKQVSKVILKSNGGEGCLRELIDDYFLA